MAYDDFPPYIDNLAFGGIRVVKFVDDDVPTKFKVRVTPFVFGIDSDLKIRTRALVNSVPQVEYHLAGSFVEGQPAHESSALT